jgi:hypothetical protein
MRSCRLVLGCRGGVRDHRVTALPLSEGRAPPSRIEQASSGVCANSRSLTRTRSGIPRALARSTTTSRSIGHQESSDRQASRSPQRVNRASALRAWCARIQRSGAASFRLVTREPVARAQLLRSTAISIWGQTDASLRTSRGSAGPSLPPHQGLTLRHADLVVRRVGGATRSLHTRRSFAVNSCSHADFDDLVSLEPMDDVVRFTADRAVLARCLVRVDPGPARAAGVHGLGIVRCGDRGLAAVGQTRAAVGVPSSDPHSYRKGAVNELTGMLPQRSPRTRTATSPQRQWATQATRWPRS